MLSNDRTYHSQFFLQPPAPSNSFPPTSSIYNASDNVSRKSIFITNPSGAAIPFSAQTIGWVCRRAIPRLEWQTTSALKTKVRMAQQLTPCRVNLELITHSAFHFHMRNHPVVLYLEASRYTTKDLKKLSSIDRRGMSSDCKSLRLGEM